MKTIEYTPAQAATIAARYNELAATPIDPANVWALFNDDADAEMAEHGYVSIEIREFKTKTGRPETIWITEEDISWS